MIRHDEFNELRRIVLELEAADYKQVIMSGKKGTTAVAHSLKMDARFQRLKKILSKFVWSDVSPTQWTDNG